MNDSDYGNELAAVEREYENHQKEHKIIHQFHTNVDKCAAAEVSRVDQGSKSIEFNGSERIGMVTMYIILFYY